MLLLSTTDHPVIQKMAELQKKCQR